MARFPTYCEIQMKYIILGEVCYNNFHYSSEDHLDVGQAAAVLGDWEVQCLPDILAIFSTYCFVIERSIRLGHNDFVSITETSSTSELQLGTIPGEALPPFVTATLLKIPDNAARLPAETPMFNRPGRIPFSGLPESAQVNNAIESSYRALLNAICLSLIEFDATTAGGDATFRLDMTKGFGGIPPTDYGSAPLASLVVGRIGTQNTRKS